MRSFLCDELSRAVECKKIHSTRRGVLKVRALNGVPEKQNCFLGKRKHSEAKKVLRIYA